MKKKQHRNWLSVIWITIFYDLFIHTNPFEDTAYNQTWLNERLTTVGKLRRNKVLKIYLPIKYITLGFIFALLIIRISSSDILTTLLLLIDLIVVVVLIWSNR